MCIGISYIFDILSVAVSIVMMRFVMMWLQDQFYDITVIHHEPSVSAIVLNILSSVLAMFFFIGEIAALLSLKQWMTDNRRLIFSN